MPGTSCSGTVFWMSVTYYLTARAVHLYLWFVAGRTIFGWGRTGNTARCFDCLFGVVLSLANSLATVTCRNVSVCGEPQTAVAPWRAAAQLHPLQPAVARGRGQQDGIARCRVCVGMSDECLIPLPQKLCPTRKQSPMSPGDRTPIARCSAASGK